MTAKRQRMHCGELKFPGTRNRIHPEARGQDLSKTRAVSASLCNFMGRYNWGDEITYMLKRIGSKECTILILNRPPFSQECDTFQKTFFL